MPQSAQEMAHKVINLYGGGHYPEASQFLLDQNAAVALESLEHLKGLLSGNYYGGGQACCYFLERLSQDSIGTRLDLFTKAVELQLKYGQSDSARQETMQLLEKVARTSPDLVIAVMNSLPHDWRLCLLIERMVATGSRPIAEHIRVYLASENSFVLTKTIIALGKMGDSGTFELLLPFLQHSDEKIRIVTLDAIFLLSPTKALSGVQSLAFNASLGVQTRSIQLMGTARDPSSLHLLRELLDASPSHVVRLFAAKSIGQIAPPEPVAELTHAMHDLNPEVRGMAAWAAGETHNDSLLEELLPLTRDTNQLVAWSAQNAVNKIQSCSE